MGLAAHLPFRAQPGISTPHRQSARRAEKHHRQSSQNHRNHSSKNRHSDESRNPEGRGREGKTSHPSPLREAKGNLPTSFPHKPAPSFPRRRGIQRGRGRENHGNHFPIMAIMVQKPPSKTTFNRRHQLTRKTDGTCETSSRPTCRIKNTSLPNLSNASSAARSREG